MPSTIGIKEFKKFRARDPESTPRPLSQSTVEIISGILKARDPTSGLNFLKKKDPTAYDSVIKFIASNAVEKGKLKMSKNTARASLSERAARNEMEQLFQDREQAQADSIVSEAFQGRIPEDSLCNNNNLTFRRCLVMLDQYIQDLNSDLGGLLGQQLPLIDINMACRDKSYLDKYELELVPYMDELLTFVHQFDMNGLLGGGGKVNQKGGFGSKDMVYGFAKKLFRFIKRAAACSLLASAGSVAISVMGVLLTKVGVSAAAAAAPTINATMAVGATAVMAPSMLTVIPPAVIAGCGVAIAAEIFNILRSNDGLRRPFTPKEEADVENLIDHARKVALQGDLDSIVATGLERRQMEDKFIQLRGTMAVGLTQVQLGQANAAIETGRNAFTLAIQNLWVLNLVVKGLIKLDKIVDFVADLPEDMITLAKGIAIESTEEGRLEKFYELKGKVIISTLLLGAGLPSPLLQILSVPVVSAKIGSELYKNVHAIYDAGFGAVSLELAEYLCRATLEVAYAIFEAGAVARRVEDEDRDNHYLSIRKNLDSAKVSVEKFNDLIQSAKGTRSGAEQQVQAAAEAQAAAAAAQAAAAAEESHAAAAAQAAAAEQEKKEAAEAVEQAAAEAQVWTAAAAEEAGELGGGSRRRRRNNKPRKRRTLRKKSKRRKSTRRNSRKTTVRRKSRRLSRKSKRLSRKLKK